MSNKVKKTIIIGLLFMLMTISIEPINAHENKRDLITPKTVAASENILADITMTWESFFYRFSLKDLLPIVTINQSATKDFYFPEVNGTIPQINFSVVCKHRLNHTVLIPRFTRVYIAILYNDSYILLNESINHRCKNLEWEYINFTASNDQIDPLITNGENVTLTAEVGAYFFFFGYWGEIKQLDTIVIHPIPALPK